MISDVLDGLFNSPIEVGLSLVLICHGERIVHHDEVMVRTIDLITMEPEKGLGEHARHQSDDGTAQQQYQQFAQASGRPALLLADLEEVDHRIRDALEPGLNEQMNQDGSGNGRNPQQKEYLSKAHSLSHDLALRQVGHEGSIQRFRSIHQMVINVVAVRICPDLFHELPHVLSERGLYGLGKHPDDPAALQVFELHESFIVQLELLPIHEMKQDYVVLEVFQVGKSTLHIVDVVQQVGDENDNPPAPCPLCQVVQDLCKTRPAVGLVVLQCLEHHTEMRSSRPARNPSAYVLGKHSQGDTIVLHQHEIGQGRRQITAVFQFRDAVS